MASPRQLALTLALMVGVLFPVWPTAAAPRRAAAKNTNIQWMLPYKGPNKITLKRGETVTLKWNSSKIPHNVYKFLDKATFDKCVFKDKKGNDLNAVAPTARRGSFTVKWPGKRKVLYFGCDVGSVKHVGGHCYAQQKIAVVGA